MLEVIRHPGYWNQLPHGARFPFGQNYKPVHDLLLGSILQFGARPQDLTWATFLAGVFVGVAPLSILLGQRVLAEVDGLACLVIAVYLWARWAERPSRKLLVATLGAFALTMGFNYRLIPTVLPFVGAVAWLAWRNRRQGDSLQSRSGELFLICLLPGLTITAVYLVLAGGHLLHLPAINLPSVVHDQLLRSGPGTPLPFANADFYFRTVHCGRPQAEFDDTSAWSRQVFLDDSDTFHLGYDAALDHRNSVLAANDGKQRIAIYDLSDASTASCQ